jgi:tetratricopeptide (TPR) repeat protein
MIETKKAHELDIVELTEDLPEFGLRRGERGTVVESFDNPEEAYMLEFVDESGASSRLAYGVKPDQIKNIDVMAKEIYAEGMAHLQQGNMIKAARDFRRAIELIPSYIRGLHESLRRSIAEKKDWQLFIPLLRFVRLVDPSYEIAKHNLAVAYLNYGVQEANNGNYEVAIQLFQYALRIDTPAHITNLIKKNIAAGHTALGMDAHEKGKFELSKQHFEAACTFLTDDKTRRNLGMSYYHLAIFYTNEGDLQKAITCYEWAEDSGLIVPNILNNHARALAISGEIDEAILLMESAQSLAPEDKMIKSNLAILLQSKSVADFITETPNLDFHPTPFVGAAEFFVAA